VQGPVTLGHEIAGDIEEVGEISKKVIEELYIF
jgi:D-arabinose 1-dehydrogenase-like Zn-dependent alcohol dehydrogenase